MADRNNLGASGTPLGVLKANKTPHDLGLVVKVQSAVKIKQALGVAEVTDHRGDTVRVVAGPLAFSVFDRVKHGRWMRFTKVGVKAANPDFNATNRLNIEIALTSGSEVTHTRAPIDHPPQLALELTPFSQYKKKNLYEQVNSVFAIIGLDHAEDGNKKWLEIKAVDQEGSELKIVAYLEHQNSHMGETMQLKTPYQLWYGKNLKVLTNDGLHASSGNMTFFEPLDTQLEEYLASKLQSGAAAVFAAYRESITSTGVATVRTPSAQPFEGGCDLCFNNYDFKMIGPNIFCNKCSNKARLNSLLIPSLELTLEVTLNDDTHSIGDMLPIILKKDLANRFVGRNVVTSYITAPRKFANYLRSLEAPGSYTIQGRTVQVFTTEAGYAPPPAPALVPPGQPSATGEQGAAEGAQDEPDSSISLPSSADDDTTKPHND